MKCQWILGGEDPLEKAWQPTPVFLPGEFYGQKSLAGYSPRDGKESDTTEQLTFLMYRDLYYTLLREVIKYLKHSKMFEQGFNHFLDLQFSSVTQLCPTLCDPMDCSPPGSSVHRILQARILKWVAISFSRDSSNPGIEPGAPALLADSLLWAYKNVLSLLNLSSIWTYPIQFYFQDSKHTFLP